jgi:hypothetical protein
MGRPLQAFPCVCRIPRAGAWLFDRLTAMPFAFTERRAELKRAMQHRCPFG